MTEQKSEELQQVLMQISLKDDQISSLKKQLIMIEKRANIKVTEGNYKLVQQKGKVKDLQYKIDSLTKKTNDQINKLIQQSQNHKQQFYTQKFSLQQKINQQTNKILQMQQLFQEERAKNKILKEENENLNKRFEQQQTIFPLQEILAQTQIQRMEQLPCYLNLWHLVKQKNEELVEITKKMQRFKTETIDQMEESLNKLNVYQDLMQELKQQNSQLSQTIQQKQQVLQSQKQKFQKHNNILQQTQLFTNQRIIQLNNQIKMLKENLKEVQNQNISFQGQKKDWEQRNNYYQQVIRQYQIKQEQNFKKIDQLNLIIEDFEQVIKISKEENVKETLKLQQDVFDAKNIIERQETTLKEKQAHIQSLTSKLMKLQQMFEQKKDQGIRFAQQLLQITKKKNIIQQQFIEQQQKYKLLINDLQEQINNLKPFIALKRQNSFGSDQNMGQLPFHYNKQIIDLTQLNSPRCINNLQNELGQTDYSFEFNQNQQAQNQQKILQEYECTVRKHNTFIKQMQKKIAMKLKIQKIIQNS